MTPVPSARECSSAKGWRVARNDGLQWRIQEFHRRFAGQTLPFLADRGWDGARGGLAERLRENGSPDDTGFRRSMPHARQLYVFSCWAGRLNDPEFAAHADRIFTYMTEVFWDSRHEGWFDKVSLDGAMLEPEKDLYAHAFALFGLGAYRHALARANATPWLDGTLRVISERFRRADGSFSDRMSRDFKDIASDRRSQNPHMHLLEAALSIIGTSEEPVGRALAETVLELFENRFLDSERMRVLEHLDGRFDPHPEIGHRIEPGHHFEWAWLLDQAARTLGVDRYREMGSGLLRAGIEIGWDRKAGGVFDEVDHGNGGILRPTKRIWPVTELIKALAVLPEACVEPSLEQAIDVLLEHYLGPDGRWIERFNADWSPADRTMPSSTAYHVSVALRELERVHPPG